MVTAEQCEDYLEKNLPAMWDSLNEIAEGDSVRMISYALSIVAIQDLVIADRYGVHAVQDIHKEIERLQNEIGDKS